MRSFGADNVYTAHNIFDELEWLQGNRPSIAIVDLRLSDGYCDDDVRDLVDRGIPFVVYSGDSSSAEMDVALDKVVWLMKPAAPEAMRAAIASFAA